MVADCSPRSNMRSTRGRCSLNAWKTGCLWALGCQKVSTAISLVLRHSASVHIGSTLLYYHTSNQTSLSLAHVHKNTNVSVSILISSSGTSNIRQTLKWFPLSGPLAYHARWGDVAVLLMSTFLEMGQTLSAAGVNTYLRTTVKPLGTCARSVSRSSLSEESYIIYTYIHIYI